MMTKCLHENCNKILTDKDWCLQHDPNKRTCEYRNCERKIQDNNQSGHCHWHTNFMYLCAHEGCEIQINKARMATQPYCKKHRK